MATQHAVVSIGLAGTLSADTIATVAPVVERGGFHGLWVNDTPHGDSLAALAAAARVTDTLKLATGVIPIDRRPPDEIARAIATHALPEGRVFIGIGAGQIAEDAVERVRNALRTLRDATAVRLVVGALGPQMRRLGATQSDGPLLNWLTPDAAETQTNELRGIAPEAWVALYVRTALDPRARSRLEDEASRYGAIRTYADNFARIGATPLDAVLPRPGDHDIEPGLAAYRAAVDEVVLRAITPTDDADEYLAFVEEAAQLI